jgi:hypothetical protein
MYVIVAFFAERVPHWWGTFWATRRKLQKYSAGFGEPV